MDTFDIGALDAQDEATLVIKHPTTLQPTTWTWTFFGPGHPRTIELANNASREMLDEMRAQKQAQLNGKKIKVDQQNIDELRAKNVASIVARTKTFSDVILDKGGDIIKFSPEVAATLLLDRRKGWLFGQISDYLKEDESFIQPSAKA